MGEGEGALFLLPWGGEGGGEGSGGGGERHLFFFFDGKRINLDLLNKPKKYFKNHLD